MIFEPKVKAAGTGASAGGVAAGIADYLLSRYALKGVDPVVQAEVFAAVPAIIAAALALAAGWRAPHVSRPDLKPAAAPVPSPGGTAP